MPDDVGIRQECTLWIAFCSRETVESAGGIRRPILKARKSADIIPNRKSIRTGKFFDRDHGGGKKNDDA